MDRLYLLRRRIKARPPSPRRAVEEGSGTVVIWIAEIPPTFKSVDVSVMVKVSDVNRYVAPLAAQKLLSVLPL